VQVKEFRSRPAFTGDSLEDIVNREDGEGVELNTLDTGGWSCDVYEIEDKSGDKGTLIWVPSIEAAELFTKEDE
jgi:hypothetical protein